VLNRRFVTTDALPENNISTGATIRQKSNIKYAYLQVSLLRSVSKLSSMYIRKYQDCAIYFGNIREWNFDTKFRFCW